MSGKPIRLKDLFPVHFTPIKDRDDKTALIAKQVNISYFTDLVPRL
jgi:hypothetical protein